MEDKSVETRMDALDRKLDVILEEIGLLRTHRREMEDLKDDLTRVGKDLFQTAVVELEGVQDQFRTVDVVHLGKKLMRNVNTITRVVEQLESFKDFMEDASPLARETFIGLMNKLDDFDRKGYFGFMKEMGKVADNVVTSFTAEDVKNLGDNMVAILNTVKSMTEPDMLHAMNNALSLYKKMDLDVEDDVSLLALLREMNTPQARKGMALAIRFLKSMASQNGASGTNA
jgi:uncharacterized protein YjgD (DUF1641 family)